RDQSLCDLADTVGRERYLLSEGRAEVLGDRPQAKSRRAFLGASEVRAEHRRAAVFENIADGVEARVDSRRIGDTPLVERHVKVASHQRLAAVKFKLCNRWRGQPDGAWVGSSSSDFARD